MALINEKQKRFVEEYLLDLNAAQAAVRAGYKSGSASRLLSNPAVKSEIDTAIADRSHRTGVSQDKVIRELAKIAFYNASDIVSFDDGSINKNISRDDIAAVSSMKLVPYPFGGVAELEIKTYDKLKALELLGKHLNLFSPKPAPSDNGILSSIMDYLKNHESDI